MELTFVDLSFSPSLQLVSMVREFVGRFYSQLNAGEEVVDRVSLATHELLENAVKYSLDGLTRVRIEYWPVTLGGHIVLRTWNRPRPEDLTILQERMAELERATDPSSYYQQLLERASKRQDGSGLGLGRVWAEAEMTVRYALDEAQVCITAEARIRS